MSGIDKLLGLTSDIQKTDKSHEVKKARVKSDKPTKESDNKDKQAIQDKADISDVGRTLLSLQVEAMRYINEVKRSETLSDSEIKEIRARLESNYYLENDVIEEIVNKLMTLPNFL